MTSLIQISPSLLSADLTALADEVRRISGAAEYAHCDVMDGHFVPNLTFGLPVVKRLKKLNLMRLDVHLMIENPGDWVERYCDAGLEGEDFLVFHLEAEPRPRETLEKIRRRGVRPGLSIKPDTPLSEALEFLPFVEQLLIMTVEPGFSNQTFREYVVPKIAEARAAIGERVIIAVDGGINPVTALAAARAGARLLIAGGAVFDQPDPVAAIRAIREAAEAGIESQIASLKRQT